MPRRSAADINTPRFELVRTTPLDLPEPPAHLSESTQQWWRAIIRDYEFGPHHLPLLDRLRIFEKHRMFLLSCSVSTSLDRHRLSPFAIYAYRP
jgi:hypothetical protein